jgi:hypothetical protein
MPLQKDSVGYGDSVGVKIFRGNGNVEAFSVEDEKGVKASTDNPLESLLIAEGKLEGKNLAEWQVTIWRSLAEVVGRKLLNVDQKKFLFRARLEIQGDPICRRCLCFKEDKCLAGTDINTLTCDSFIPSKEGIPSLWQWILQGRILSW